MGDSLGQDLGALRTIQSKPLKTRPKPFLKWAGGKRQLLPELMKALPDEFYHYYEPFVGGGALFFNMRALGWGGHATLADSNDLLMRTYLGVRNDVEAVIDDLKGATYSKEEFLEQRARQPFVQENPDPTVVAAWLIYLNKTCFNGLWRVNSKGQFNVPFGRYTNPTICDAEGLRACASALRKTKLLTADFERTVKSAETGDLVYLDPPYAPVNTTSDFTGYTKAGFDGPDQERLRDCALKLKERGVHVILSNADVEIVRKLYRKFNIRRVEARRAINSKATSRGSVGEVIIT